MQGPGDSPDVLQRYQSAVDQVAGQIRRSIGGSVDHDHLLGSGCEGLSSLPGSMTPVEVFHFVPMLACECAE